MCLQLCGHVLCSVAHHRNVLSGLLEFVFDAASNVSKVRQRELIKLRRPQDAGVGIKHLQRLDTAEEKQIENRL